MKWPWSKPDESAERGTLTLLPDGLVVLGLPMSVVLTPEMFDHLREGVRKWASESTPRAMVLGFPVDVVDHRNQGIRITPHDQAAIDRRVREFGGAP